MMRGVHLLGSHSRSLNLTPTLRSQATNFSNKANRYTHKPEDDEDNDKHKTKQGGEERLHLHKSRGQHLLTNPRVLDSIVRKAQLRPTDTVLEIGPGTGNLTLKLLESTRKVVAVEIDERMVDILRSRAAQLGLDDRLTVIVKDVLKTQLPEFDVCVANIPYGISSPLLAKLLFDGSKPCFRSATLLLQKEFAQRLLANPGDSEFNRLAVNVKLVATVEFLMNVSKRDFVPCPKVDSTLIRIQPRTEIPAVDLDEWRAFTRTCFSKKNKTIGAIFKQKKKVIELFERSNSNGGDRKVLEEEEQEKDDDEDDGHMGNEGGEEMGGDVLEVARFKEMIVGILKAGGFEEKRPSKLSNEELLHLLHLFNQAGIRFR